MNIGVLLGVDFNVPLWLILLVVLMVIYYWYMTWHFNVFKNMGIGGPKPYAIMGTMTKLFRAGLIAHDSEVIRDYGKVAGVFMGRQPVLLTTDLEIIRGVMVREFNSFPNRKRNVSHPSTIHAKMLTQVEDDRWRHIRNSLSPTFSAGKLKLLSRQININADSLLKHIERHVDEDNMFEFKEFSGAFTMDVIAGTAFGIQLDSQTDSESQFLQMSKKAFNFSFKNPQLIVAIFLPCALKLTSRLGVAFLPKDMLSFFKGVVRSVLQQHEKQQKAENFIQLCANALVKTPTKEDVGKPNIIEDESGIWTTEGLTEDEILANAVLFFLAGYETTANSINFAAYLLAVNPEIQDRLIEQIDTQLHGKEPIYEDLNELQYLDNIISETLRMYPQAPRLQRHCSADVEIEGINIRKGMAVGICVWNLHYDPVHWPEPEKFDPDRFTAEGRVGRDPFVYQPFGQGPRSCIAMRLAIMEMKICIIRILQKYRLVPTEKTPVPMKLQKLRMIPEDGNWLNAKPRDDIPL